MSKQPFDDRAQPTPGELPLLSREPWQSPTRVKQPVLQDVDQNGDVIFRFRLDLPEETTKETLKEFYRGSIRDLLKIVRFYSSGKPVTVDSFAFLNKLGEQIKILD